MPLFTIGIEGEIRHRIIIDVPGILPAIKTLRDELKAAIRAEGDRIMATIEEFRDQFEAAQDELETTATSLSSKLGDILADTDELKRRIAAGADAGALTNVLDRFRNTVTSLKTAVESIPDILPDFPPAPEGEPTGEEGEGEPADTEGENA